MKKENGYTLTEILVTMVIVALLAGIAIPRFTGQNDKALSAEAISIVGAIKTAEYRYFDEKNNWYQFSDHCGVIDGIEANLDIDVSDSCGPSRKWRVTVEADAYGTPAKIRAIRL